MKIVFVLNGFYNGYIRSVDFMTHEMEFVTLKLEQLESVRTSGNKMILTYNKASIDGKDAYGMGKLISEMKCQAICVEDYERECVVSYNNRRGAEQEVCVTDIHIYDRTKSAEVYIIPKNDISSAIIDKINEV